MKHCQLLFIFVNYYNSSPLVMCLNFVKFCSVFFFFVLCFLFFFYFLPVCPCGFCVDFILEFLLTATFSDSQTRFTSFSKKDGIFLFFVFLVSKVGDCNQGQLEGPFSIATTPRYWKRGYYYRIYTPIFLK